MSNDAAQEDWNHDSFDKVISDICNLCCSTKLFIYRLYENVAPPTLNNSICKKWCAEPKAVNAIKVENACLI